MLIIDIVLIVILFLCVLIGAVIMLVKANVIILKNAGQITVFNSALIILILIFLISISARLLTSEEGKRWLDSFSDNSDCDRIDRPYWCDL